MQSLLTQALVVLIPGALVTAATFRPGSLNLPGRLALTFAGGYSVVSVVTWILALFSILSRTSLIVGLTLVAIASAIVAWRRAAPRKRLHDLVDDFRSEPWINATGLAVVAGIAWARFGFSPLRSLTAFTGMRFWGDGVEIATAGEVPNLTLQWGQSIAPAASKMAFNCFTAAMHLVGGPHPLINITGAVWLGAVAIAPVLWWLGRELGLKLTAPLLPLLLVANPTLLGGEFTNDLLPYRAESFGRVVAFSALALAILRVREKGSWGDFAVVGALFGIAAATHLVPTVVSIGILFWYVVYRAVRRRLSLRLGIKAAAGLALAGLLAATLWFLPGATLAFTGVAKPAPVAGPEDRFDPTALFGGGRRVPLEKIEARDWNRPPSEIAARLVEDTTGGSVENAWLWLGLAAIAMVTLVILAPDGPRPVAIASLATGLNILVAALVFARVYDAMAMANFGQRRLFDYAHLVVWLLILLLLELLLVLVKRLEPRLALALLLVSTLAIGIRLLPDLRAQPEPPRSAFGEIEVLNWVRENAPCDARILSNLRTSGAYQVLTGRAGVAEGMGPFFRPELLRSVNRFLIASKDFYMNPLGARSFLEEHGVDYVVLYTGVGNTRSIRRAQGYPQSMERAPFLQLVFTGQAANIYRVEGLQLDTVPRSPGHPGYVCQSGSIQI